MKGKWGIRFMPIEEKKYRVHCPFSNRPEDVFVRTVDSADVRLAEFNGCNNGYHKCKECDEICYAKVQKLFAQECGEEPRVLWRMP